MKDFKVKLQAPVTPGEDGVSPEPLWSGEFIIKVPDETTRLKLAFDWQKMSKSLSADDEGESAKSLSGLYEMARLHCKELTVSFGESKISDIDTLAYCAEFQSVALEICKVVVNGPKFRSILPMQ